MNKQYNSNVVIEDFTDLFRDTDGFDEWCNTPRPEFGDFSASTLIRNYRINEVVAVMHNQLQFLERLQNGEDPDD